MGGKTCPRGPRLPRQLPYSISIPSLNAIVVHAGIVPDRVLNEQKEFDMMMMRNVVAEEDQASLKALIP